MILTAHQPQFFAGYAGYISKLAASDIYVYMDDVDYEKGSYTARNRIRTSQGWQWLTVPVLKPYGKIKDIRIDNTQDWRKKHLKSIRQNYSKAPFYDRYMPAIEAVYMGESWQLLSDFNLFCLVTVLNELGVTTSIIRQSDGEYRGVKSELILDMCLQTGATEFIFGGQGKDYADVKLFYDAMIDISFQEYKPIEYPQVYPNFVPNCGIIDLLFCMGQDSLGVIRGKSS